MNELKLTFVALALAAGAVAVSTITAGLSVLPNSSSINALTQEVASLKESNKVLEQQLKRESQNRARIDELDVGLTAIATVLKIDRNELAKAISLAKDANGEARLKPAQHEQISIAAEHVTASASDARSPAPTASHVQKSNSLDEITTAIQAQPAATPPESVSIDSLGADNPFTALNDSSSSPASIAASKASEPKPLLSIDQVDGVLAKRISENWYKPAGVPDTINAIVQVKMARDGKVAAVKLTKASGNLAFDNSAISAIKSIGAIDEVQQLSDADFQKGYESRSIQFTPQMGG